MYGWTSQVGGRPFKTTDGGLNWIELTNLNIWDSRDIYFRDYQNGCLVGFNELYKTTDSGTTWILNPNVTGFNIAELSTFHDSTIFIIGDKTFRSLDAGESWFEFTELSGITLTGMSLFNPGFGYSVGELGLIMKYYDSTYIPVELVLFIGESIGNNVILSWNTVCEINNKGFEIERTFSKSTHRKEDWFKIGFVNGHGTTTEHNYYSFTDESLPQGKYQYRLKQIDYDGTFEYSNVLEVVVQGPTEFLLLQNYPNPFNNSTVITYQIPTDEFVILKLYDVLGKEVITLIEENKKKVIIQYH